MCACFLYNVRFEKGNAQHRNSPGDCFGALVRAAERRSEAGESRRLRQRRHGLCIVRDDFLQGFGCRRNTENIFFMWFTQTKPVSLL